MAGEEALGLRGGGVSRVGLRNGGGGVFARRKARVRSGVGA